MRLWGSLTLQTGALDWCGSKDAAKCMVPGSLPARYFVSSAFVVLAVCLVL